MVSIDSNNEATFSSDSTVGSIVITSPSNVGTSNNSYIISILLLNEISNYLKAHNFRLTITNTQLAIPHNMIRVVRVSDGESRNERAL